MGSSVAKALHLSAQGVYLMPARHDQEGAPKAGSNDWIPGARPGCMPFALLGEQAEVPVALISWFHDARQRPASAKQGQATEFVRPCESAWTKRGEAGATLVATRLMQCQGGARRLLRAQEQAIQCPIQMWWWLARGHCPRDDSSQPGIGCSSWRAQKIMLQ